ncbi:MAG: hypothetical protein Fur0014_07260 [Rubrivivax sp.]
MKFDGIRHGFEQLRDSVAEGWERLRRGTASALTRYQSGQKSNLPAAADVDDTPWAGGTGWAMLGGDVFEDNDRLVVRLEAPGMARDDFQIEVVGDLLTVRGEKRFERESTEGRWRVLQCAYGSFQRSVPLPVPVRADAASARYRDGVLRIELPKLTPGRPAVRRIAVR